MSSTLRARSPERPPIEDDAAADVAARRVSRNGGTARITLRDSITGGETEIRVYTPYEVALQDLVESELR